MHHAVRSAIPLLRCIDYLASLSQSVARQREAEPENKRWSAEPEVERIAASEWASSFFLIATTDTDMS
eukprot:6180822-Pleurochrysis_carterae.AAC.2